MYEKSGKTMVLCYTSITRRERERESSLHGGGQETWGEI